MNRNVFLLALAQAMMISVNSLMITTAAIVGSDLSPEPALATLPLALQLIAVMSTAIPASLLMRRIGRRAGFLCASLVGICAGVAATLGLHFDSFALFCLGSIGVGIFTGFGNYFRFAATEVSPPERKNTAISYVLAGGVLAAVVGPNLANYTRDLFAIAFVGSYFAVILVYLLSAINFLAMRLPPPATFAHGGDSRSLTRIAAQPTFVVAVCSATIGYGLMAMLMTATPLAMTHAHGHVFGDVAFVIQWHVLGMFVPSFFTGQLINRFGAQRIVTAGSLLMLVCVALNLHGASVTHFWAALLLLGVGWNFMFIGGTSLLTETYRPSESAKTQALNDSIVFSGAALGSLGAGALIHWLGWRLVNVAAIPFILLALGLQLWLWRQRLRARVSESLKVAGQ
ncbi:MAG: MFS transporter [Gammaproteobacteria bacterium]|nr:MFS transporter [Gammaproteobacteria bacterium]